MAASPFVMDSRTKRFCSVIGAPSAEGQSIGGVENGPRVVREAGLQATLTELGFQMVDCGDVDMDKCVGSKETFGVAAPSGEEGGIKACEVIGRQLKCLYDCCREQAATKNFVLNIGGDHGIAGATIGAMLKEYPDLAVLWIDAHADSNTPWTSPSAHYHGMPCAHLMGWFGRADSAGSALPGFDWVADYPVLAEERVALVGLRDVDAKERTLLKASKVHCETMHHIDRDGIAAAMKRAIEAVDPEKKRPIHLSFDIDSCDPTIAPGTGTLCRGGLSYREAHYIAEVVHQTGRLVSMDLVEVNPDLESDKAKATISLHGDRVKFPDGAQISQTAKLAVQIIGSALGTSIL